MVLRRRGRPQSAMTAGWWTGRGEPGRRGSASPGSGWPRPAGCAGHGRRAPQAPLRPGAASGPGSALRDWPRPRPAGAHARRRPSCDRGRSGGRWRARRAGQRTRAQPAVCGRSAIGFGDHGVLNLGHREPPRSGPPLRRPRKWSHFEEDRSPVRWPLRRTINPPRLATYRCLAGHSLLAPVAGARALTAPGGERRWRGPPGCRGAWRGSLSNLLPLPAPAPLARRTSSSRGRGYDGSRARP